VRPLPPAARTLVDATLAQARLTPRDRAAVRAELEAHFHDGLRAGNDLESLVRSYGDPLVVGALIGRAKRRSRLGIGTLILSASAAVAILYAVAVFRLERAAPPPSTDAALEREAAIVLERVDYASRLLGRADGIVESYSIAAGLRARHTLWAETESLVLLEKTLRAADSLSDAATRATLRDSLAALAERESLQPRRAVIDSVRLLLVDRLFGREGRVDRAGLTLLRRTKGVEHPSAAAVLLEPVYFAPRLTRLRLRHMVDASIKRRLDLASSAGAALVARVHTR